MELVRAGVEDRTWQAFWRFAVDGRPVADVAEELGMSVAAFWSIGSTLSATSTRNTGPAEKDSDGTASRASSRLAVANTRGGGLTARP